MRVFLKKDMTFRVILRVQVLKASRLMDFSRMAIQVRKRPIGTRTKVDMKSPMKGVVAPSRASFVPEMSTTQYRTKNRMDTTAGVPRPPLRMSEPMGAPIKNRMKQASACAYFFQISTSDMRRRRLYS